MGNIDLTYLFTTHHGRIGRGHWWIGAAILFVTWLIISLLFGSDGLIAFLLGFALLFAGVMLHIKRFHDRGKSGWWVLILFIPVIGFIWAIVDLGLLEGTPGPNEYGPAPAVAR